MTAEEPGVPLRDGISMVTPCAQLQYWSFGNEESHFLVIPLLLKASSDRNKPFLHTKSLLEMYEEIVLGPKWRSCGFFPWFMGMIHSMHIIDGSVTKLFSDKDTLFLATFWHLAASSRKMYVCVLVDSSHWISEHNPIPAGGLQFVIAVKLLVSSYLLPSFKLHPAHLFSSPVTA